MTSSGDRFAVRFGESGVRRFRGRHAVPTEPEATVLARIDGLVLPLRVNPYFHTLLEEPASILQSRDEGGRVVEERRVYPVRAAAYEVLTAWGIDVPRPTISESLPARKER